MTAGFNKDHHDSAATHNQQAARFHRETYRCFEASKNWKHLAHQAMVSHHHDEASRYCAEKDFDRAVEETRIANRHAQQSAFYSYEVVKQYLDRNKENWTPRFGTS